VVNGTFEGVTGLWEREDLRWPSGIGARLLSMQSRTISERARL